ncbi:hypothetical protein [Oscillatoria sp. FACHB-1406]|uniref:hypothetical protein n=1 Tax=Oscillatoria sp. FACHB-1406 TaxID=2692846 RepID=UPI0016827414|nr:hypothetical protein [Oscillatoria sp. FACHB-1406]MBD2578935.1 hypothetical protein [Oscillatoria sp. FACHB-1406]
MEPLSIILAALATAATKIAASKAAETATNLFIPDAYNGLKNLIKQKFEAKGKSNSSAILDKYEEKPEKTKALLEDELKEAGIDRDDEIIKAARELLEQLNPQEANDGKFNVHISGGTVQGLTQQNLGNINQNFS